VDSIVKGAKYVLDADIAKCFDKINHQALLLKIGLKGQSNLQLKYWLEAGVLDGDTFNETTQGTPQGGVISPLLANIALHGLESHLKRWISQKSIRNRVGNLVKPSRRSETLHVIRYADDFVVLHTDKEIILEAKEEVKKFLKDIGLELSAAKTRLTHTLELKPEDVEEQGFDGVIGFNFLGFTFKQFKTRHRSAKTTTGERLGYKTLVYPSRKSIKRYQTKLHQLVLQRGKEWNQKVLIQKLNPLIRGWASYFGTSDANTTGILVKQDYLLYLKLRKWAKRKTGTSGKGARFWTTRDLDKWHFATR
jgi:RNA-directed DNA polymerase